MERARALEGRQIILLRSLSTGFDWVEEHHVRKVLDVIVTPSAPEGAIHFTDFDPKFLNKDLDRIGGQHRIVGAHEICEVIPPVKRPPKRVSA